MANRIHLDRETVIILFGLAIIGLTVWLFLAPATFPTPGFFESIANRDSTQTMGILLGIFIVVVAGARFWRSAALSLDRSPIRETAPEGVSESRVRTVSARHEGLSREINYRFDSPGRAERHVAMYGRRAFHTTRLPRGFERVFDDLALTARDVYATATGCDEETAARAIAEGTWTDDRIAAAYLAWDVDSAPTFSTRERLVAWLAPRRTFERRLERVVTAIENHADGYLTYDAGGTE